MLEVMSVCVCVCENVCVSLQTAYLQLLLGARRGGGTPRLGRGGRDLTDQTATPGRAPRHERGQELPELA